MHGAAGVPAQGCGVGPAGRLNDHGHPQRFGVGHRYFTLDELLDAAAQTATVENVLAGQRRMPCASLCSRSGSERRGDQRLIPSWSTDQLLGMVRARSLYVDPAAERTLRVGETS